MYPPSPPLQLRPFGLADAATVAPWLSARGLSLPPGAARADWPMRMVADERVLAYVGTCRGELVVFARLDCGPDRIAEVTLVVAPGWRGHGIGAQALQQLLVRARRRGIRRLHALVDASNDAALRFFLGRGFEEQGTLGQRWRLVRIVHAGDFQEPLEIEV